MKKKALFFAHFQTEIKLHDRMAAVDPEEDLSIQFIKWIEVERKKIEQLFKTGAVVVNCKIVNK